MCTSGGRGRILASVCPECEGDFLSVMSGVPLRRMGEVSGGRRLVISGSGAGGIADLGVDELVGLYREPLYSLLDMSKGDT
jgi:hypothetical protein